MRLPIYRRLDEGFRLLGLSLKELMLVGGVFVLLGELLKGFSSGRLISLLAAGLLFLLLQLANRRLEPFFLEKFIRYIFLPRVFRRKLSAPSERGERDES